MSLPRFIRAAALAATLALPAVPAVAQDPDPMAAYAGMVARFKADPSAMARMRANIGQADSPMPADRAKLDAWLADRDYRPMIQALDRALLDNPELPLNWERMKIFEGAGMIVPTLYVRDLWRVADSLPEERADPLRQTAVAFALYVYAVIEVEGGRCADAKAPAFRRQQLLENNRPLWAYAAKLSKVERERAEFVALVAELATSPVRKDDDVLCQGPPTGSLMEMVEGLEALAAAGKEPTPIERPDTLGKAYEVPRAPPKFRPAEAWRPGQEAARAALPAKLEQLVARRGAS